VEICFGRSADEILCKLSNNNLGILKLPIWFEFMTFILRVLNHLYQQTTVHLKIRNRCLDVSIKLSWVGLVLGLGIQSRFKKTVFQTSKSFNSSLFSLVGVRPRECIMRVELKIFQFSIFIPEQIKSSARFAMGSLVRETEKPSKIFLNSH
jgi:hypothetical protein